MDQNAVSLLQALIRCPSVTPAEGGALEALQHLLDKAGFRTERLTFSEPGTPDVQNLFARIGTARPCLADCEPPEGHAIGKVRHSVLHLGFGGRAHNE